MPGISLVRGRSLSEQAASRALDSVCFTEQYRARSAVAEDSAFLGVSGYPDYPVRTVETPRAHFVLEGHLYDVADEERQLRRVGAALLDDRIEEVASWLRERDGDFVVAAHEKSTGTIRLLNDAFARLPLHYATVCDDVLVSRELKFVLALADHYGDSFDLDSMAVAQYLLLGYPLGDRTLYDGVRCVPPGSYVRIDDEIAIERVYRHDFDTEAHADRSVEENAAALASLFEDACANRDLDGVPNVVSLSGGLDSRAVGGGYDAAGASYTAATFEKPNGANAADVRLAERVADALGVDWEHYRVEETEEYRAELLETKQGMNFLAMSFILDFFDQLRARHGPLVYVTGDGGDKALPDLTPPREFDSRRGLAEYVVDAHSIFEPTEAAAIAGIDPDALYRAVAERLDSYPEATHDGQYVHFLVRERGVNWLTHAEDRNRHHFWSVSPFYSLPFFEYAMDVPADQKRYSRLYAAFLEALDPALCDIENANSGATVDSLRHKVRQFGVGLVTRYPKLKRAVADLLDDGARDGLAELTASEFRRTDETPFADERIADVLRNDERYDGHELYNLLTLVAVSNSDSHRMTRDVAPTLISDGAGERVE